MDWNLNTPTEWDWENLAIYSSKEMEVSKNLQFSSQDNNVVIDNVDFSFSASLDSSSKETIKGFGAFDDLPKDFLEKEESSWVGENGRFSNMLEEESVLSGETMIGLNLGSHENTSITNIKTNTTSEPLFPNSSPMIKRSRASYLSSHSPRCQVEGCNLDLSSAKDYHRRHRICANHSKSPKVVVGGMERRFCQQCSRFHDLTEFDDRKRSCRRRLSAHNARRRRPQSDDIQFSSTRISSSINDRRPHMNFLRNRASIPVLDSAPPEGSCKFKGEESLIGLARNRGIDVLPTTGSLHFGSERFTPRNVNHNGMDATCSSSILSGDVRNAFSLLSTSSWSSNWREEPASFDQFAHGNSISLAQPGMPLEVQSTTTNPSIQDFQSFRSLNEFERFYSS